MSPLFSKEKNDKDWFIDKDQREYLAQVFEQLEHAVPILVFTKDGSNDPYNEFSIKFCRDLAKLSSKLNVQFYSLDDDQARKYDISRSPTLLVDPENVSIRFTGTPAGEEGKSFITSLFLASRKKAELAKSSTEMLEHLSEKRHIQIFVNPTCPYCPNQVINGLKAAVTRPDRISVEIIETNENQDLAEEFDVGGVPHTVINGQVMTKGFVPEELFISEVLTLKKAEELLEQHSHSHHDHHDRDVHEYDVVIVGAGPAGLTAGIYLERSGLKTIILEKSIIGGMVAITPVVENYPGFQAVAGKKLMEIIEGQARYYSEIHEGEEVLEVKIGKNIEAITARATYISKALIFATGATWKKIGAPGEETFFGRGVSYCSTCDGYLYKDKKVYVVGGGNTALTDALYLKNLGADVTIIHRGTSFSAEEHLVRSVEQEQIPIKWEHEVDRLSGDTKVSEITLKQPDGSKTSHAVEGLFVAIGEEPNSLLPAQIGLKLDDHGAVAIDRFCRTNIPRIYSAGDVTGGVNQIVTAVGEGATAAMSAFEDISRQEHQAHSA